MRVTSNIEPMAYLIERNDHSINCTVTICANIVSSTNNINGKDTMVVYTYDKYTLTEHYRANLEVDIKSNFDAWVAKGSNKEKQSKSDKIRSYRNKLLNDCDLKYCNSEKWNNMNKQKQKQWVEYKIALRDITAQDGFPYKVVWPKIPD